MSREQPHTGAERVRLRRVLCAVLVVAAALLGSVAGTTAAPAVDYYNNSSDVVQTGGPQNATLDNIVRMAISLPPDLIGTGEQDPSATGFQGVLLTGVAYGAVALFAMASAGVGIVGGSVLGFAVSYGLADAGFAPEWTKVLLIFVFGIVAFSALRRVIQ